MDQLVPVDAKFPLDNFERMTSAENRRRAGAPRESVRTRRQGPHRRDLREVHPAGRRHLRLGAHVPARARRSITSSSAARSGALLQYAHDKRVFPVSATTFTAYLQVIAFGLKGMQIERNAQAGHGATAPPCRPTSSASATTSTSSASTSRTHRASTRPPRNGSTSSRRSSIARARNSSRSSPPSRRRPQLPRALDDAA